MAGKSASVEWVEPFATITVQNMRGIASAFALRAKADKSLHPSYALPRSLIPRHRVSPSASPMTGSSGVSSTPRLFDFIIGFSAILDRPPERAMTAKSAGDDGREGGAFSAEARRRKA